MLHFQRKSEAGQYEESDNESSEHLGCKYARASALIADSLGFRSVRNEDHSPQADPKALEILSNEFQLESTLSCNLCEHISASVFVSQFRVLSGWRLYSSRSRESGDDCRAGGCDASVGL